MKTKIFAIILICCVAILSTSSISIAAESPTCDEGDIKNASVQIDNTWYLRPDSRIDGQPATLSKGPFPVRANLEQGSEIVHVQLSYSYDGENYSSVPMDIGDDNIIRGEIPALQMAPAEDTRVHFFLDGLNAEGSVVWTDEIPYTCPPDEYTHGDPYNFIIAGVVSVVIDIKPDSETNCINSDGHGVIPVAILTTADFDASTVDPFSVALEGSDVRVKGKSGNAGSLEDVDGDGDFDLVVQIIDDTALIGKDTATLTGNLLPEYGDRAIEGTDTICIVP